MLADPIRRRLCLAAPLWGVSGPALTQASSGSPGTPGAAADPALEIGLLPNISARILLAQYQPMRAYLARELGRPVQVSTAPHWAAFHQRTLALEYHLVVTAAHLARLAQLERGWQPLLLYSPNIRALLITAQARPLRGAAELRGRTLVLSNPQSLVSMRGMQWLAEQGLLPERDFRTVSTPTDDSVGNVVLRGDAAAALLSGGEFRAMPAAVQSQLQVLSTFAEVPGFIVMASPRLGAADVRRLREQLLQFGAGSEEAKAFFAATGFNALLELPTGLMESLDAYSDATRRALAA